MVHTVVTVTGAGRGTVVAGTVVTTVVVGSAVVVAVAVAGAVVVVVSDAGVAVVLGPFVVAWCAARGAGVEEWVVGSLVDTALVGDTAEAEPVERGVVVDVVAAATVGVDAWARYATSSADAIPDPRNTDWVKCRTPAKRRRRCAESGEEVLMSGSRAECRSTLRPR